MNADEKYELITRNLQVSMPVLFTFVTDTFPVTVLTVPMRGCCGCAAVIRR